MFEGGCASFSLLTMALGRSATKVYPPGNVLVLLALLGNGVRANLIVCIQTRLKSGAEQLPYTSVIDIENRSHCSVQKAHFWTLGM